MASLNLSAEELRSVEQTRQRLSQLSNSISSLKHDVFKANPFPDLFTVLTNLDVNEELTDYFSLLRESLQASSDILQHNLGALLDIISQNNDLFSRVAVHPSTNFPGRHQQHILEQLLRKKPEPGVAAAMDEGRKILEQLPSPSGKVPVVSSGSTSLKGNKAMTANQDEVKEKELEEVWRMASEACMSRIVDYAMNEESDPFTAAEREVGIENVRTGLRRTFEEEYEEEYEDDEDEHPPGDGDEDDDLMMIVRPPPPPAPDVSMQEVEGTTLENIMRFSTRGEFGTS